MPRFLPNEMTAGPPPAVLLELDIAWERSREMFASDLELHFEVDEVQAEVWAELRLADGSVVERLTASEALALACGDVTAPLAVAAA